jgi:hypothetical protein
MAEIREELADCKPAASRDELVGRLSDLLVRRLSPERALITLRRHIDGIDPDDVLLAVLTLLTWQRTTIEDFERENIGLVRRIDQLESECNDLDSELDALRIDLRSLHHSHDDPDGDHA